MSEKVRLNFLITTAALAILCLIDACTESSVPTGGQYLLKVGDRKVTPQEFEQVFEIARVAYPTATEGDPEVLEVIRHRVLVEMIEELLISLRAEELGIRVSGKELDKRIAEIRQDYPEGAFDEIFVEQAVPFEVWKNRTRVRLLLDKVIAADLKSPPAPGVPAEPVPETPRPGAIEKEETDDARAKEGSPAADDRYQQWIHELAQRYPVEVNTALWKKLYGP
jgi:hypothetical protein